MRNDKVMIAAEPLSRFREATERLEVCDPQGRTLGYFLPPDLYQELMYAWVKAQFGDATGPEHPDDGRPPMTTGEAILYLEQVARSGGNAA
jgi:hypothetical protein